MRDNAADLSHLSPQQKRARLAELLRERAQRPSAEHPISYGQQALWFLYQLASDSPAYNLVYTTRISCDTNLAWLRKGLQTIVGRHPILRTTYSARGGRPVQIIHSDLPVALDVVEASAWSDEELDRRLNEEADRPFDLEQGPVIRAKLFANTGEGHVLSLCRPTTSPWTPGPSLWFSANCGLSRGEQEGVLQTLPPLEWQYTDYGRWQTQMLTGPKVSGLPATGENNWPDAPRRSICRPTVSVRPFSPTAVPFSISIWARRCRSESGRWPATCHALHGDSGGLQALLYRYTGQEDLLVGSPTAGRSRSELEGIVGYFVNPLVIRARLSGDLTFCTHLDQVRDCVLDALAHQDYPFPLLVEQLQLRRDPSRSPLFQVAFDWYTTLRTPEPGIPLLGSGVCERWPDRRPW